MEPFQAEEFPDDKVIKVACSLRHMSEGMQKTIQRLDPVEMVRLGGAGNKVNRIALREVDCYV